MPPSRIQRVFGALLGVHAGDALGATFEFELWSTIRDTHPQGLRKIVGGGPFGWPAGHATDDTDLTRAVLLAYRDAAASTAAKFDVVHRAGEHMLDWLQGNNWPDREPGSRPRDAGNATVVGLHRFAISRDADRAGAGPGAAGNGSLMRCIPTALFQPDEQLMIEESQRISAITHNDPRCTVACAAYNAVVRGLIDELGPAAAVEKGLKVAEDLEGADDPVGKAMRLGMDIRVADLAANGPDRHFPGKASGYVLESLTLAISALLDDRPLVDVLVDVVRVGCDTDTNAAVAGGVLGARDGVDGLPVEWRKVLQFGEEFTEIAKGLIANQDA